MNEQGDDLNQLPADFDLESYDYDLPDGLVAAYPPPVRGQSRLMTLARRGDAPPADAAFADLPHLLPQGALLVVNNSRVFPARLRGRRVFGGKIEFLPLTPLPLLQAASCASAGGWREACADCLLRCGGKIAPGESIKFADDFIVEPLEREEWGRWRAKIRWKGELEDTFSRGEIPLPPYLKREAEASDLERYQTVYAKYAGSVAAPTAGLHFTAEMQARLLEAGFGWAETTLHVGYGTFSPVRARDIREHQMHAEYAEISEECAVQVSEAKKAGRPVIAIGTTSLRALEGAAAANGGEVRAWSGWIDIFLHPGKEFGVADGLLTNFHLPKSTLLMLVAAFCGRERILNAYRWAIGRNYRFFSYGDAMLIS